MHLGIIGFGNIGRSLLSLLNHVPVSRVTLLVRSGSEDPAQSATDLLSGDIDIEIVSSLDHFIEAEPDLAVECAGHDAVLSFGPGILESGINLVIVSVGALADKNLHAQLAEAAGSETAGRMIFPIGAIGGLDLLSTLAPAGDLAVTYTGTKPPAAWKGSPAETALNLDTLTSRSRFFAGTAREAAILYPKNANVVAALSLAGAGFDKTRVELVADANAAGNTHAYSVVSPICRYSIEISALPSPDNPRTSATTAWSVLKEIKSAAAVQFGNERPHLCHPTTLKSGP